MRRPVECKMPYRDHRGIVLPVVYRVDVMRKERIELFGGGVEVIEVPDWREETQEHVFETIEAAETFLDALQRG